MEENDKTNPNSARKLAIVLRDLSQQELQLLVTETAGASLDIQLPDGILPEGLNANPVRVLDVDKIYQESYEDAFEDVLGFGELQLKNGNTLAAQLKGIDGRSWWYYLRFMALYKYRSKLNDHRLLEQINQLKKEYADVLVFHQSGYMHTQMQGTVQSFVKRNADKSALITNTFRFIFIFLFRVLMGITQVGQLFRSARHVLLTNAQPNQTIIRKADLSEIRGDHFAEYLQDAIEHPVDGRVIQQQSVDERLIYACARGIFHVNRIGCFELRAIRIERLQHPAKSLRFGATGCRGNHPRGHTGIARHKLHIGGYISHDPSRGLQAE